MLTWIMPALFGVGVTTSVARAPLTRVKVPLVPPVTVMSSTVKLVPTSSLKVKVKVTSPVAWFGHVVGDGDHGPVPSAGCAGRVRRRFTAATAAGGQQQHGTAQEQAHQTFGTGGEAS
jgi:hypothetical protein